MTDVGINIPVDTTATAEVNGPTTTTLYDPRGIAVAVDSTQVDHFLSQYGFSRTKADPAAHAAEFAALTDAAKAAVGAWVSGLTETGTIDPHPDAAYQAAVIAVDQLTAAWSALHSDAHALYPVAQGGDPVTLTRADGATIQVDPGQVDLYNKEWNADAPH